MQSISMLSKGSTREVCLGGMSEEISRGKCPGEMSRECPRVFRDNIGRLYSKCQSMEIGTGLIRTSAIQRLQLLQQSNNCLD